MARLKTQTPPPTPKKEQTAKERADAIAKAADEAAAKKAAEEAKAKQSDLTRQAAAAPAEQVKLYTEARDALRALAKIRPQEIKLAIAAIEAEKLKALGFEKKSKKELMQIKRDAFGAINKVAPDYAAKLAGE